MALILKDRVKQQTTTTGTGTYTLSGSFDSFQTFAEIGDGNTTYYCCTDGTDFEVGRGTFTASGTTLSREEILSSSNSDAKVNWSAGTRTIFCTQPADRTLYLNNDRQVMDTSTANSANLQVFSDGANAVLDIAGVGPNFIRFRDGTDFTDLTNAVDIKYRTNPNDLLIEQSINNNIIAEFGGDDGHAALFFNGGKKLETLVGGVAVTGTVTDDGATHDGDVTFTGDSYNVVWDKSNNSLEFADNAAIRLGTANDFSMQHNGSNTVFHDGGSGGLVVRATTTHLKNAAGTEFLAKFIEDGAVELYYDNAKKLETTADGVDIISTDDGNTIGPKLHLYRDSASPADFDDIGSLYFSGNDSGGNKQEYAYIRGDIYDTTNGTEDAAIRYFSTVGGNAVEHMQHSFGQTYIYGRLYLQSGSIHSNPHIQFEGSTYNNFETSLYAADPTADRTITLPDATGTVALENGNAVLLNTTTVSSGVSSVDFGSSLITDDFNNYLLVVEGLTVSAATDIRLRLGTGNSADTSTIYTYNNSWRGKSLTSTTNNTQNLGGASINQSNAVIMGGNNQDVGTAATQSANFTLHLQNLRSTTFHKTVSGVTGSCFMTDTNGTNLNVDYVCSLRDFIVDYQNTSAVNFISIYETDVSSQISGGTFSLYGLKT